MSDESVFKFVTLRAPTAREAILSARPITPLGDTTSEFDETLDQTETDGSFRERLRIAADKIINSGTYLLGDQEWRDLYGARGKLYQLIESSNLDAKQFRSHADAILEEISASSNTNHDNTDKWTSVKLKQRIWASYLASIFSLEEQGQETRFFLNLIRLVFAYEQSLEPGFKFSSLDLRNRRAAIPPSIAENFVHGREISGKEATDDYAGTNSREEARKLEQDIKDLTNAIKVLDQVKKEKRQRLVLSTQQILHTQRVDAKKIKRQQQYLGKQQIPADEEQAQDSRTPIRLEVPAEKTEKNTNLQQLALDEIQDKKVIATLNKYGLDPSDGVIKTREQLKGVITARLSEIRMKQSGESIVWNNGTFIRVMSPITITKE